MKSARITWEISRGISRKDVTVAIVFSSNWLRLRREILILETVKSKVEIVFKINNLYYLLLCNTFSQIHMQPFSFSLSRHRRGSLTRGTLATAPYAFNGQKRKSGSWIESCCKRT